MRRFQPVWCLAVLIAAVIACAWAGPGSADPPAGESEHTLSFGGKARSYLLYAPESLDRSKPAPLVFIFHGGGGNARNAVRMSGFHAVAERHGFLAVYPNGSGRLDGDALLTWNGGGCCGYAQENDVDDAGFIRAVAADVGTLFEVDSKRIYATGMSNGGILSHRLACEAADLFAAVAPVAGTLNFHGCNPSQPVSIIEFHGTDDRHILYDGGYGPSSIARADFASVAESISFWVTVNRCASQTRSETRGELRIDTWEQCADGATVELYTIAGGGHEWPGSLAAGAGGDLSGSELIWEFFERHPKP